MQKNNLAIILSGGEGKRFDSNIPKQFFTINNQSIIEISVNKLISSGLFKKFIIVSHKDHINKTKKLINNKDIIIITGGKNRQESVFLGLKKAKEYNPKNVLIHDSVRPFFSKQLVISILNELENHHGAIPSLNIYDSVRQSDSLTYDDIPRKNLKLIQTPQGFRFNSIFNCHKNLQGKEYSDDSIMFYEFYNTSMCHLRGRSGVPKF